MTSKDEPDAASLVPRDATGDLAQPSGPALQRDPTRVRHTSGAARQEHRAKGSWENSPLGSCLPTPEVYERMRQAGDHNQQLVVLHKQYGAQCLAYARKLPCVRFTPDDVVQEMLEKIAKRQSLNRYRVSRAWVLRCLKNAWIDLLRKHRQRPPFDPALESEAQDAFDLADLRTQLSIIFASLRSIIDSDPCKAALFDDWQNRLLERPSDDEMLKERCGGITAGHLKVKRHRWAQEWDPKLALRVRQELGDERLRQFQAALRRASDATPPTPPSELNAEAQPRSSEVPADARGGADGDADEAR
jgi:DNA-directed RNA polymerase specialized sigma24 family protein